MIGFLCFPVAFGEHKFVGWTRVWIAKVIGEWNALVTSKPPAAVARWLCPRADEPELEVSGSVPTAAAMGGGLQKRQCVGHFVHVKESPGGQN